MKFVDTAGAMRQSDVYDIRRIVQQLKSVSGSLLLVKHC